MKSFNPRMVLSVGFCLVAILPSHTFAAQAQTEHHFHFGGRSRLGDLGCYGQKLIKTPNIDELAQRGTLFTQFYAGSTVCAPRAAPDDGKAHGPWSNSRQWRSP